MLKKMLKRFQKQPAPRQTQIYGDDNFAVVEAFKTVRTNLMFALSSTEGGKVVIFTSSTPCEGKSTCSLNVAVNFAKMGKKTLLIDADLRKPRIHKVLNLKEEGLTNYLGGFSELSQAITHVEAYDLDVMVCGTIPPNPSELLGSTKMEKMIQQLKEEYEYILIDTPPVNTVTDAAILSEVANGIVMVVREDVTTYAELSKAISALEFASAKILGIVVNDSLMDSQGYKYRGKYSKTYRYQDYSYGR